MYNNINKNSFKYEFAFIGAGNMGTAIIDGMLSKKVCRPSQIIVKRRDNSKNAHINELGVSVASSFDSDFTDSRFIFIAVKPTQVKGVLSELVQSGHDVSASVFVSICAAVSTDYISRCLGFDAPVIRIMPSTPMMVGKGTAAISKNDLVTKNDFEFICRSFSTFSQIALIPEETQNAVISVNGSSPAYVYLFIKAILEGAAQQGISEAEAMPLILKTIEGSVEMVRKCGLPIDQLIKNVSSPNGTTLEALKVFYNKDLEGTVSEAMRACTKRADEISDELE